MLVLVTSDAGRSDDSPRPAELGIAAGLRLMAKKPDLGVAEAGRKKVGRPIGIHISRWRERHTGLPTTVDTRFCLIRRYFEMIVAPAGIRRPQSNVA